MKIRAATFVGKPCQKCGGTLRYMATGHSCVQCTHLRGLGYSASYRKRHPETRARYHQRYKDREQRNYYQKKYGIDPEEVDLLLEKQGGGCAICGSLRPEGGRFQRWHVDHDHASNELRGILCGHCNRGLGLFKDNPEFLRKAIAYLEKPSIRIDEALNRRQRSLFVVKG